MKKNFPTYHAHTGFGHKLDRLIAEELRSGETYEAIIRRLKQARINVQINKENGVSPEYYVP